MSDLEKELQRALASLGSKGGGVDQMLKDEVLRSFDDRLKWTRHLTWVFLTITVVIEVACLYRLLTMRVPGTDAGNVKTMMVLVVVIIIMGQTQVLMKLWYWVMNTKINVLKEVKQLQLQVAEFVAKGQQGEA